MRYVWYSMCRCVVPVAHLQRCQLILHCEVAEIAALLLLICTRMVRGTPSSSYTLLISTLRLNHYTPRNLLAQWKK